MMKTEELRTIEKSISELAGHVLAIAKRVYAKDEGMMPYDDEDADTDYTYPEDEMKSKMKKADEDDKDKKDDKPDFLKSRATRKGYDDSAEVASDEEDAKFGDPAQGDVPANEPSPAGEGAGDAPFTGNREDETFNVHAMQKAIADLQKAVGGSPAQTIVNSKVPASGQVNKGRQPGAGEIVTREMQEAAKGRSYKELNRLREEIGDLPKHGIAG